MEGAEEAISLGNQDPRPHRRARGSQFFGLFEPEAEPEAVAAGPPLSVQDLHLADQAASDGFAPAEVPGGLRPLRRVRKKTANPVVLSHWGASKLHPSHNLRLAKGALWCIRCGCFAATNVRKLGGVCGDKTDHGVNTLKRILKGQTPVGYLRDWPDPGGIEYSAVLVPDAPRGSDVGAPPAPVRQPGRQGGSRGWRRSPTHRTLACQARPQFSNSAGFEAATCGCPVAAPIVISSPDKKRESQ